MSDDPGPAAPSPSASGESPPQPPKRKLNPYVIGFLLGAVVLTVLPFLQRGCLRAPPPLAQLGPWQGRDALRGQVWIASFVTADCTAECEARQADFGRIQRHLDDLKEPVSLVTLVEGGAQVKGAGAAPHWQVIPVQRLPEGFAEAWQSFGGSGDGGSYAQAGALALVDQNGAVRGFWPNDEVGRGNLINAARMIAKYGPQP